MSVGLSPGPSHRMRLVPEFEMRVPSASDPGYFHTVTLLDDGSWECDCHGFRYAARADGLCRHIDQARPEYEYRCSLAAIL